MSENLPPLEERVRALLELCAERIQACRGCGEQLYFLRHKNGNLAPYTAAAVNHFIDCPAAQVFRKAKNV